jgi:hypothetical protein
MNIADADVRSLAFLSRLTEALHVSPFYSHLECGTVMGIGTSSTPFWWYMLLASSLRPKNQVSTEAFRRCVNRPSISGESSW